MTILKPDVPGTIIRFIGERIPRILPSAADTVAVPIIHDWGPVGTDPPGVGGKQGGPQEVTSFEEFALRYGDSDTAGRTAVAGAFAGQNLPGAPGAGGVIVYRLAGASAATARVLITDVSAAHPTSLTLAGKFVGSRANRFAYTIDTDPINSARDRLRLYYNGGLQETYLYNNTDITSLANAINLRSKMVTATESTTGNRLTPGTLVNFAGGDDGATLTSADHLDALDALSLAPFSVLAAWDLTDPALQATYLSWVQAQADACRPVMWVVGGAAGETIDDALARTQLLEDPHVVNFGVGTYHDDLLDKDLSTSQLASRIAGILAAKGEEHSLTYSKIGGLHVINKSGASPDGVEAAVTLGVTVLMPAAASDADLRIAKGVTTFTNDVDPIRPLEIFSDARLVRVMDLYTRNMKQWGDDIIIGDLPVNDDTRGEVYGHARALQGDLLRRGLILPGDDITIPKPWVIVQNTDIDPTLRDAIPYTFGWQFAFTTNAILGEGHVR